MMADEMRAVGRVKDAHGLKGEIWVVLFAGQADWLESLKEDGKFWLSKNEDLSGDAPVEFALKGVRPHKNGLILQTAAIKDRTQAEGFKGHFLAIPETYLESEDGDVPFLDEIEGFQVFEKSGVELGPIIGFESNGLQDLLVVELKAGVRPGVKAGDRVEIPFVESYVDELDYDEARLTMTIPDQLIEVQLGLDRNDPDEKDGADDASADDEQEED